MVVLGYVLALVLSSKSYLARSEPDIVISLWSSSASEAVGDTPSELAPKFCSCQTDLYESICTLYTFPLPSFGTFDNFSCAELPHSHGVKLETQQVFVTTAVKVSLSLPACSAIVICHSSSVPELLLRRPDLPVTCRRSQLLAMPTAATALCHVQRSLGANN